MIDYDALQADGAQESPADRELLESRRLRNILEGKGQRTEHNAWYSGAAGTFEIRLAGLDGNDDVVTGWRAASDDEWVTWHCYRMERLIAAKQLEPMAENEMREAWGR